MIDRGREDLLSGCSPAARILRVIHGLDARATSKTCPYFIFTKAPGILCGEV